MKYSNPCLEIYTLQSGLHLSTPFILLQAIATQYQNTTHNLHYTKYVYLFTDYMYRDLILHSMITHPEGLRAR